ncbi:Crp/Fnr family transcriptional regulator [Variovorax sp. OV329]|uniref:Crp/Fnr family transcriptional regulator n=1 Tax=Variovorax sp. OV329 TaxID=1882825 RepID=UPI0008E14117|nr:cyclic nucleotide-binding domain-containing protein [Variovorax sp. OV329]SFM57320.1 Cyclic nucleotide-binding domain-containing protein [Variovorax sp. OV329]
MQQDNTLLCEALQQMAIFGGVNDEALYFLLARARIREHAAGSYIAKEGDVATGLFVLLRGRVSVQRYWNDHQVQLRELGQGDCFGEMALLDLGKRSASILALEDCTALEMGTDLLHDFFEHDASQFALLQMNIARELSRRLRRTFDLLFSASTAPERAIVEGILRRV